MAEKNTDSNIERPITALPTPSINAGIARKLAQLILDISDIPAIAITDLENTLAYINSTATDTKTDNEKLMQAAFQVVETKMQIIVKEEMTGEGALGSFKSALVAPLTYKGPVVGTVILFTRQNGELPNYMNKLAGNASQLLEMLFEITEINYQTQLMTEAKLDALQAQINPHFLYNTINTIIMLIRTDPEMARELLYRFSLFFRHSLKLNSRFVTLKEELDNVDNYLTLEKARFGSKIKIVKNIDKAVFDRKIPILSIQPLVENAVIHGITPKEGNGTIRLVVSSDTKMDFINISVIDDGIGIKPEVMPDILKRGYGSGSGVGLSNVDERLKMLFGQENGLRVDSVFTKGTKVSFSVPR